jgi:hypothetical protein
MALRGHWRHVPGAEKELEGSAMDDSLIAGTFAERYDVERPLGRGGAAMRSADAQSRHLPCA